MLIEDIHPNTLAGVKRLAKQFKKTKGIRHSDALELAAKSANFESFRHAQRSLPMTRTALSKPYILLTIYWSDKELRHRCGRETLRIELSMPILDLCEKSALRYVRGFGNLRMVAGDHFVCDDIAPNQEYARSRLCTAERSLRFMEHTGLRPYRNRTTYPKILNRDKLPNMDHSTDWIDQASGQFVLVDEPYGGAPDVEERAAWADRTGWRIEKTGWPGLYSPYNCDLYVGVDESSGYDLDSLIGKIDAMPAPMISGNWTGESVSSWETFLSPLAKTRQDERRARCKGMIYPSPSKSTVPYNYNPGCSRRRPIGELGIDGHIEAGRIIKAAMRSEFSRSVVYTRMSPLRSDLEGWMSLEIGQGQLEGPEFFEVYYQWTDEDQSFLEKLRSMEDVISALRGLVRKLKLAYPDCAPLRQQLRRVEMSILLLEKVR
ncbi:DUF5623 domain-containing protein [uncultured Sulfitobacter sp.]|uniref:DUF5623 domain-containing protein n=1 Tax=uncultured Sulfitobacter sp. TaxID=191468 RepID=UPI00259747EB|nr:DUF5623 domain-containing protein [uncultured Sulfitobacter sp.]